MSAPVLLELFLHFASLSLLAIGGALAASPEMHRYLVEQRGWMSDAQFTDSIAIAQAAPGPNILFVALLGWQAAGVPGAAVSLVGIILPSSLANFWLWRWKSARDDTRLVGAIRLGLAPIAIGLTASAGWLIASASAGDDLRTWALAAAAAVAVACTRINLMWLIAAGAALGALGVVA
ncbi:MAG TPA: chromate transporter [Burkholderiaceae bacterium]|nr:chromate transporter [Burkholderiaceae bacterium]